MEYTNKAKLSDFDLAFGYEAMARALACEGDLEEAGAFYDRAKTAGEEISDSEDRKIFLEQLKNGPWFDLDL